MLNPNELDSLQPVLFVAVGLLGLLIGSFLNVVISRVPQGESLMGRSACPRCGHQIRPWHNIPLLGWFLLRGKCHDCGLPISAQYPIVEGVTGALFVSVLLWASPWAIVTWPLLLTLLFFAATSVALTVIDWQTLRLPNAIVYPTVAVTLVGLTFSALADPSIDAIETLTRVGISAAGLAGAYFLLWLGSGGRAIGFGDVKLAVALGAILGYYGYGVLAVGTMAGWVLGAIMAVIGLATGLIKKGKPVPFGPALILGTWVGIFLGAPLWSWYAGLMGL